MDILTDKENVNSLANAITNVRSVAHGAMTEHINGAAKNLNKRSCGLHMSNAAKIKSLLLGRNEQTLR